MDNVRLSVVKLKGVTEAMLKRLGEDEESLPRGHNFGAVCVTLGALGCRVHANAAIVASRAGAIPGWSLDELG